jgi:dihydroxyacetone kinase-like protein
MCARVRENRQHLSRLDAACGDGDHGESMARGFQVVEQQLEEVREETPGGMLVRAGGALVSHCGGATGPLMGTFFIEAGKAAGSSPDVDVAALAAMFRAGYDGLRRRGRANPGEKTILDALLPAVVALEKAASERSPVAEALKRAAKAADEGAQETAAMIARQGKARYLGERSLGHPDPGACSMALIVQALAEATQPGARDD